MDLRVLGVTLVADQHKIPLNKHHQLSGFAEGVIYAWVCIDPENYVRDHHDFGIWFLVKLHHLLSMPHVWSITILIL